MEKEEKNYNSEIKKTDDLQEKLNLQDEIINSSNKKIEMYKTDLKKSTIINKIFVFVLIIVIILSFVVIFYVRRHKKEIIVYNEIECEEIKNNETNNNKVECAKIKYEENRHNAKEKLDLLDAYGGNQPTHPKILNFEKEWNGYKYWMVYSPYPHSDDKKENPHIVVSNDLENWVVPKGLKNPLDNTDYDYKNEVTYLSDPHLVYNSDKDILECYYRKVDDKYDRMILYRKTSKDGVNWSDREEILRTTRSKKDYVSPAIIYENGIYKVWYVNKNNTVCYAESEDGYNYSECKKINLKYPVGVKTWHLDVIKTKKGYEMITVAYISWDDRARMNLYYFSSDDETSFETEAVTILYPSITSWDNRGFYRSSFIYENDTYYLIYSAISESYERGLGLSYGKNIKNLKGSFYEKK